MRILKCSPHLEVSGINLHAWINNIEGDVMQPILERHGLTDIQADKWYSCQKWLDTLNDLAQTTNMSSTGIAIGLTIGQTVPLPPDVVNPTLPEVLNMWDGLYQYLHRGGDAGGIVIEKISDTHYRTRHTVLYPDDLSYGVLYGYGRRFLPKGTQFKVYYDESAQRMDEGGAFTDIHIQWE